MTPAAKEAQLDFVRLSAEEPSSLYFEAFLRDGYSSWPSHYQQRFPGLRTWPGVSGLKQSIRRLVNAPDECQVLLAGRSMSLVNLASSCMFRVCRHVLSTDLSWPTYQQSIERCARRTGNRTTTIPLRDDILYRGWKTDDVACYVADAFTQHQCDGLFLPAVDHLGIRLPIRNIMQRIRERSEPRFCFIDAAQAFCHVPLDDSLEFADFIIAGSHKWMGAYLPTGIGLFGQSRSRGAIKRRAKQLRHAGRVNDPLMHFSEQLDSNELDGHSETANLTSLFACAGAASDQFTSGIHDVANKARFVDQKLATIPRPSDDWHPLPPNECLRSRIVLFESGDLLPESTPAEMVRQMWLDAGCVVTAYPGGRARLSMAQ